MVSHSDLREQSLPPTIFTLNTSGLKYNPPRFYFNEPKIASACGCISVTGTHLFVLCPIISLKKKASSKKSIRSEARLAELSA